VDLGFDGLSCFGKLPFHPEFISGGRGSVASTGLDRWIGEGLAAARAAWGADYDRRMSALPIYDFAWPGGASSRAVVGRMVPSRDLRGRHHPFLIFSVPFSADTLSRPLPLRWAPFQVHLASAVESLAGAASVDEVTSRVCRSERIDGRSDAPERYQAYLQEAAQDLWSRIESTRGTRYQVLQALLESLDPFRGREIDGIPLGIRIPLGEEDPDRRLFEISFWTDLAAARLGRPVGRATHFWSAGRAGGGDDRPVLFLFFSTPTSQQFAALVEHGLDIDTISYLERPYGKLPPEERMNPEVRELLSRPEASLRDVLERARPG
jgi:type VI secretion system protein ImpM